MSTLVAYTTRYGSTKQYAEWIASEVGAKLAAASDVSPSDLDQYDTVVCGCYLRMGRYRGFEFLKDNWEKIKDKKVILFTVSGAPAHSPEQAKWFETNVPTDMCARIVHVALQGRSMNLNLFDRALLAFPKTFLWIKYLLRPTPENRAATRVFKPFDGVKKEYVDPIVLKLRT